MNPVFIGGCPRSGTTLLGTLLGAHPECCPVPESQFKIEALRGLHGNTKPAQAVRRLAESLRSPRFHGWAAAIRQLRAGEFGDVKTYAGLINHLVEAHARCSGKPEANRWIDATPSNKNFLTTLMTMFPGARAIHIVRDGRAVAHSVMRRDWGPNTVLTAAWWWLGHLSHGLAAEQALPPDRIRRIRYEDLLRRPRDTLTSLCRWLDLEYSDRMLDSRFYAVDPMAAAFNPLTTQAPRADRADAWRSALSARQIEVFEAESKEMLTYLGYEMDHGPYARTASFAEKLRMGLAEMALGAGRAVAFRARRAAWMRRGSSA
jgi:hypothetical protein